MAAPIAVDTPDYQRGIVNPQLLVGSFAANTNNENVFIPPNAETLIVVTGGGISTRSCFITGLTTGLSYAGMLIPTQTGAGAGLQWFFDVSAVADNEVQITFVANGPTTPWFVYADAGVHVVADASKKTNQLGVQYVTLAAPNTLASDHPPVELQYISGILSASGNLIGGPGAGLRYRVFSAQMSPGGTAVAGYLQDAGTSKGFIYGSNQAGAVIQYLPSGLPLSVNGAISYVLFAGSGNMYVQAVYTIEIF